MQRHQHLELTFIMFVREKVRITTVDQCGIIRLTALNRAAQIVDQRFPHQVFREIAPGLRTIIGTDAGQNTQPGLIAIWLQVAEIAACMHRFGFDVDMPAIKLEALIITEPVQHRIALFNFQRRTEDRLVRHFGVVHIHRQPAIFHATFQLAAEVLGSRKQLPLLPGKIVPRGLETGFICGLKRDIQRQRINLAARLRCQPNLAQIRGEFRRHRAQAFDGCQIQVTGADTQLIAAFTGRAAHVLLRHPGQRQRTAWPRLAVHRDARIRNSKLPALFLLRHMRGEVIDGKLMLLIFALPACSPLLQPDIAAGEFSLRQG